MYKFELKLYIYTIHIITLQNVDDDYSELLKTLQGSAQVRIMQRATTGYSYMNCSTHFYVLFSIMCILYLFC